MQRMVYQQKHASTQRVHMLITFTTDSATAAMHFDLDGILAS